ncbi:MAG: ATP-binding cassette domain-containing protein [bacterium]|nr:ATP-binding cassette domain-containing protein [bacterium]
MDNLDPQDRDNRKTSSRLDLRRLSQLALPEWRLLIPATLFLLIGGGMGLAYPQVVRVLIDATLTEGRETIDRAALWLLLIFSIQAIAVAARYYLFTTAGERIVTRLRDAVYSSVITQEIAFFDRRRTGELTSRLASDATVLQNTVSVNLSMALRHIVMAIGGIALLAYNSPRLTVVMLVLVPPVALIATLVGRRISRLSKKAQDALAASNEVAEETFSGIRTVRSFAREERETERYSSAVWESFRIARHRVVVISIFVGAMTLAGFGSVAAVLWFGGRQVVTGAMTVGGLTSFMLYTLIVAMSISALGGLLSDFLRARGASERIFELLDREPEIPATGGKQLDEVRGEIALQGIRFAYPSRPDVVVLDDLALDLEPKEIVALVGPSGAGKSTVASLMLRLYDPQLGTVTLDGQDVRELDAVWLRTQVGVVAQEPLLFSTSIEANIRYGRDGVEFEAVEAAARAANAHDFVMKLPEGYQTEVGERGIQLSGGQKQRVAIARALLKDPPVLILDEATSSLDAESESLVREALERLMQNRASLVIAHRLSTVRNADRVLVMDGGGVVESGRHNELMAQDGLYRRLVQHQLVEG